MSALDDTARGLRLLAHELRNDTNLLNMALQLAGEGDPMLEAASGIRRVTVVVDLLLDAERLDRGESSAATGASISRHVANGVTRAARYGGPRDIPVTIDGESVGDQALHDPLVMERAIAALVTAMEPSQVTIHDNAGVVTVAIPGADDPDRPEEGLRALALAVWNAIPGCSSAVEADRVELVVSSS